MKKKTNYLVASLLIAGSLAAMGGPADAAVTQSCVYGSYVPKATTATVSDRQAKTVRVSYFNEIASDIQYVAPTAGTPLATLFGAPTGGNVAYSQISPAYFKTKRIYGMFRDVYTIHYCRPPWVSHDA